MNCSTSCSTSQSGSTRTTGPVCPAAARDSSITSPNRITGPLALNTPVRSGLGRTHHPRGQVPHVDDLHGMVRVVRHEHRLAVLDRPGEPGRPVPHPVAARRPARRSGRPGRAAAGRPRPSGTAPRTPPWPRRTAPGSRRHPPVRAAEQRSRRCPAGTGRRRPSTTTRRSSAGPGRPGPASADRTKPGCQLTSTTASHSEPDTASYAAGSARSATTSRAPEGTDPDSPRARQVTSCPAARAVAATVPPSQAVPPRTRMRTTGRRG